ncbi:extracellular alkaline serine protease [Colletotrichum simmondsii]|uniref:Extracellular alkaline serine protease n=1 Tax=Colletotrichum simmondsii TaxID=703756 RepID=A0A135T388_9PEZI|nr:extracellular alkaline serine protease [Colletotrichum simmondsii]
MDSFRSSLVGLLGLLGQYIPSFRSNQIISSSESIKLRMKCEFLMLDLELAGEEVDDFDKFSSSDPVSRLHKCVTVIRRMADMGELNQLNIDQVFELAEQVLEESRRGRGRVSDATLPYGTNDRLILRRSDHLQGCLARASEQVLGALLNLSSCCRGTHVARIQLDGFPVVGSPQDNRAFGLFLSSHGEASNCAWQETTFKTGSTQRRLDSPRACLGQLIDAGALRGCQEGGHFPRGDKAALCLNLALGMLHLSTEAWIQTSWSVDNLYFTASDVTARRITDIHRPYLSRALIKKDPEFPAHSGDSLPVARSAILAFAQVVVEVHLGQRLFPKEIDMNKRTDEALLESLQKFVQDSEHKSNLHYQVIEAITDCANFYSDQVAQSFQRNVLGRNPDPEWIFDRIVSRLEEDSACYRPCIDRRGGLQSRWQYNEQHSDIKSYDRISGLIAHEGTWFAKLDHVNYILDAAVDDLYPKVKIAVLDTGIDPQDISAADIKSHMYKDFVEPEASTRRDNTGHGTSIIDLIYRVYADAEIYVARVFESEKATEDTPKHINEAINWARGHEVDVICMAFGFETDPKALKALVEHIKNATAEQILVFAAASNGGHDTEVMLPARLDDVLCIFSTDAGTRHSAAINPPALNAFYNFAMLGENVRLRGSKFDSGTSYSTAIACAFAARLLDFSRQGDIGGILESERLLKEKQCMEMVLSELSNKDAVYDCIVPWKLLGRKWDFDRHPSETDRKDARHKIFRLLLGVLEKYS